VQELRVEGHALLEVEAVGQSDDVVVVVIRQGGGQVVEERELLICRKCAKNMLIVFQILLLYILSMLVLCVKLSCT